MAIVAADGLLGPVHKESATATRPSPHRLLLLMLAAVIRRGTLVALSPFASSANSARHFVTSLCVRFGSLWGDSILLAWNLVLCGLHTLSSSIDTVGVELWRRACLWGQGIVDPGICEL